MSGSKAKAAPLPEVDMFNPLRDAPVHFQSDNAREAKTPQAASMSGTVVAGPVIGTGGYTLTVPGAEGLEAPFVVSEVSSHRRVSDGPLVTPVDGGADGPKSWKRYLTPVAGVAVAANAVLLAAGLYFVGFSGHDGGDGILAAYPVSSSSHAASGRAATASIIDSYEAKAPIEPAGDLKPRQVKIETFRVQGGKTDDIKVGSTAPSKRVDLGKIGNRESGPVKSLAGSPAGGAEAKAGSAGEAISSGNGIVLPRPKPDTAKRVTSSQLLPESGEVRADGSFLAQLRALRDGTRTRPVTIVHIGDSHIASDGFSQGIREGLQARYGDAGRGAVIPANAYEYARADGVKMTAAGDWSAANSLKVKTGPYGLSGVRVAASSPSAVMALATTGEPFDWAEATVLTGPDQGKVTLAAGGRSATFDASSPTAGSRVFKIEARGNSFTISPAGGGETTVLNWASGRESAGVRYVNFGISSATAYLPRRWTPELVANDIRHLDPDLVVWGYGTNEGFNENLDLAAYRNQVQAIYTAFSEAAPGADWLFVGPASGLARSGKAEGYCSGFRIPAKLGAVSGVLKEFAKANDRHFWDWAEAMGGPCAVDEWARAKPALAAADRVHLTANGYKKSADALVAYINGLVDGPQQVALATPER